MPVNSLTFRLVKGSALTVAEMDGNFRSLQDFGNGLETLFLVTHNPDGTIKLLGVTTAMLADLSVTSGKIAALAVTEAKVADQSITAVKIANALAGLGLKKALNGDAFSVDIDGATLIFDGNQIKVGLIQSANLDTTIPFRKYEAVTGGTLGPTLPSTNTTLNIAHSLGSIPTFFRPVIHCNIDDPPFLVGDEIDVAMVTRVVNNLQGIMAVPRAATIQFGIAGSGGLRVCRLDTGVMDDITEANWQLKAYLAI